MPFPSELIAHLRVLELDASASRQDVERAYKELTQVWHPDRFSHNQELKAKAEIKMRELNIAYQKLKEYFNNPYSSPHSPSEEKVKDTQQKPKPEKPSSHSR